MTTSTTRFTCEKNNIVIHTELLENKITNAAEWWSTMIPKMNNILTNENFHFIHTNLITELKSIVESELRKFPLVKNCGGIKVNQKSDVDCKLPTFFPTGYNMCDEFYSYKIKFDNDLRIPTCEFVDGFTNNTYVFKTQFLF